MITPYLTIDLDKITHNAVTLVELCQGQGITVTGVTKCVCGHPEVARAMLRGGVISIADSRMKNIQRLKASAIDTDTVLLRVPPLSKVDDVVQSVAISLNSELSTLKALSEAAQRHGKIHEVILMVDLGDLREGIWPDDLMPFIRKTIELRGIQIRGIGANLACFAGVIPTADNMNRLVALADDIEQTFAINLQWLSGINSSGLDLIASGQMPKRINHARIGEAILLGCETTERRPWPGTHQDAFLLYAEVLELKEKPSRPIGPCSEDAFGKRPQFAERGKMLRALLNVGREDIDPEGITPLDPRIGILGASSGYLVADVTAMGDSLAVGDELAFRLNYSALLAAMTSKYVEKHCLTASG